MELSTILVGSIILLAMLVPVVYLIMNASGSDRKAKATLTKLASSNNLSITDTEVHGNIVFGLNEASKHLVYSYKSDVSSSFRKINIDEIKSARVKTTYMGEKSLQLVVLELTGSKETYSLVFYDDNDDDNHSVDPEVALQNARNLEKRLRAIL